MTFPNYNLVDWTGQTLFGPVSSFSGGTPAAAVGGVKNSPGRLYSLSFINYNLTSGVALYCYCFDLPAASVIIGTTTPKFIMVIPATKTTAPGGTVALEVPLQGHTFANGISVSCTATFLGTDYQVVYAQGTFS